MARVALGSSARPEGQRARPPGPAVTDRQLEAIAKVARAKGLDLTAVDHMALRAFNRKPGELTQPEAAALLKELSNLTRSAA